LRLFIAIALDEDVRQRLAEARRHLAAAPCKVKWVEAQNLHLTLKFLGEVEEGQLEAIAQAMTEAAAPAEPFEMRIAGVGSFPPRGVPRVVWAGVEAPDVHPLHRRLEGILARLGHEPEKRALRPHVTMGRVKGREGARQLRALIKTIAGRDFGRCRVGEIVLMRSTLSPTGPTYTPLRRAPLAGGEGAGGDHGE